MSEAVREMTRAREVLRRYGAVGLTFLAFLMAVFFAFQVLFDHKRLIEKESKINIWFLAQTEIEFLRLKDGLKDFALGDPSIDHEQVLERFEIFWSRLPVLLHGPQSANLREVAGLPETASGAIATLEEIEPLIKSLGRNDRDTLNQIDARLDRLREPLHDMVEHALTFDADLGSKARRAHEVYYYQLLVFFAALLAGGVTLFLMFYRQIVRTQRLFLQAREAEHAARIAREQLVVAIGSVSEGFILYDESDRVVLYNERYRALHPAQGGVLAEGIAFADLVHEAARRGGVAMPAGDLETWVARCVESHSHPAEPFESGLSDGTWLKISERRTADGGIVGIHTDITELKRRETELTRTSNLLRAMLDNITQGIAVFDSAMRLVTWNDRFIELNGLAAEFVCTGLPYATLVRRCAELVEQRRDRIEQYSDNQLRLLHELNRETPSRERFERRGPNDRVIEITLDPMPDGGFIKTYSDITERARAEEQRTQSLEQQVDERTRQLRAEVKEREAAQAQLAQSQKVESIGQLTGGIAHDFNNLLTVVIGNLELLNRSDRIGSGQKLLRDALSAAERGVALTQRLLAFARKQRLEPRAVDLELLVADMHQLLDRTLGPAVQVVVTAKPNLWSALVDPNQLENAVVNLAINARDAMPRGGTLTIGLANARTDRDAPAELAPGDYVVVSVADTGVGMDAITLSRAFEPFFTTKGFGKGTGLGLSMVHGIAAQSGGATRVRSRLGAGTVVEIWLPRINQPRQSFSALETLHVATARGHRDGTILVCDDEQPVREFVATALRDDGYRVLEAAVGRAALAVLETEEPIDLLVTDLAMPGMSGREVAQAARLRRPQLPVLIITGFAEAEALGAEAAALPVLYKPFKPAALTAKVADLLRPEVLHHELCQSAQTPGSTRARIHCFSRLK
jgi:PAS domain S-box-containing protein